MKKYLLLSFVAGSVSFFSFSQTTSEKIDKIKKDQKTNENATKADAYIINKKIIAPDSSKVIKTVATKRKRCRPAVKKTNNKSL